MVLPRGPGIRVVVVTFLPVVDGLRCLSAAGAHVLPSSWPGSIILELPALVVLPHVVEGPIALEVPPTLLHEGHPGLLC